MSYLTPKNGNLTLKLSNYKAITRTQLHTFFAQKPNLHAVTWRPYELLSHVLSPCQAVEVLFSFSAGNFGS